MDSNPDSNLNLASQYALQVALQTMKERCQKLQRRLTTVEEENQELREKIGQKTSPQNISVGASEISQLRLQITELNRQKSQLTDHLKMVSNENRKLWARLSHIAKEQSGQMTFAKENEIEQEQQFTQANGNQNLIRSKTFTQHSPNPKLRHKLILNDGAEELKDISLEEVALNTYDGKISGVGDGLTDSTNSDLNFAYLNVNEESSSIDTSDDDELEAKKCIQNMDYIRKELLKQQKDFYTALELLKTKIAMQSNLEFAQKPHKPEMADKSLETDESLNEVKFFDNNELLRHNLREPTPTRPQKIDIIQKKIEADALDKTCPMCGIVYKSHVSFETFRQHVEDHFIDNTSDLDESIDNNFEFCSNTIGNF